MSALKEQNNFIDVICQHTRDGQIIPLRIRVMDEDGIYQTFSIKSYKEISVPCNYMSPYGFKAHGHTWTFHCRIITLDISRTVELFYNSDENLWRINKIW